MTLVPTGKSNLSTALLSTLPVPWPASIETKARSGDNRLDPTPPTGLWARVLVDNGEASKRIESKEKRNKSEKNGGVMVVMV